MSLQSKRVYYHEAGHAFARWYFGYWTDRAVVLTPADVEAGNWPVDRKGVVSEGVLGVVEGHRIAPFNTRAEAEHIRYLETGEPLDARTIERMAIAAEIDMITAYAGPAAEGRYRKESPLMVALTGSGSDYDNIMAVAEAWFHDPYTAEALAKSRVRALIRSEQGWNAIERIAGHLMKRHRIDGDGIDRLCRRAFKRKRSPHGAWFDIWPPTLKQLRSGFIPG